ncbi:MAG: hypothetical protein AABW50_00615 [Nanoarchaeota archaeon]
MYKTIDEKIAEEIISQLEKIKKSGTDKIKFMDSNYTPDDLIKNIRDETAVGIDYYNMCLEYRKNAQDFKP